MDPSIFALVVSLIVAIGALAVLCLVLYVPYKIVHWAVRGMAVTTYKTVDLIIPKK